MELDSMNIQGLREWRRRIFRYSVNLDEAGDWLLDWERVFSMFACFTVVKYEVICL